MLEDGVGQQPRLAARELSLEECGPLLLENLVSSDVVLQRRREQKRPTQGPATQPALAGFRLHGRNKTGRLGFELWWDWGSSLSILWELSHPLKPKLDLIGLGRRYNIKPKMILFILQLLKLGHLKTGEVQLPECPGCHA